MKRTGRLIDHGILKIAMKHRLGLLENVDTALVVSDSSAIVSPLPYAHLTRGEYEGRRLRMKLDGTGGTVTLLVRTRPVPEGLAESAILEYATDSRSRRVPIAATDPASRTIHLLLDLSVASWVDEPGEEAEIAAAGEVATALVERGVTALLETDGAPSVGGRVPERLQRILERRAEARSPRFRREIAFLRRAGTSDALPNSLKRRLELLEGALRGDSRRAVSRDVIDREVERLGSVVASRACGSLRIENEFVRGLANPARIDASYGHDALMFALRPVAEPDYPELRLWPAGSPEEGASRRMCLGLAIDVFGRQESDHDAYGLVDTVLNFIETNFVGAVSLDRPNRRHRMLRAAIDLPF